MVAGVALTLTTGLVVSPTHGFAQAQSQPPPPAATAVRAIVLVDESGSLSEADVDRERQAAALLPLSDLSTASEFAIWGFGSSNAPGQNAVHPYCELTRTDSEDARQALGNCARAVHRRSADEGQDTDHASALQAAVERLEASPMDNRIRVVFLLTDGVLDVTNTPRFGVDASSRNAEADRQLVNEILPRARASGVQIWPLGFGAADQAALQRFAAGGAGANAACASVQETRPQARVVSDPADVGFALLAALSNARCARPAPPTVATVAPNDSAELKVRIPVIATDGSIAVWKVDPRIQVSYLDPDGRDVSAASELDGQSFERSGRQSAVEALRIVNPKPGEWTVRLRAPAESSSQVVGATAVWQGAVRSVVSLMPVIPRAGQQAEVRVRLQTRSGVITDAAALEGLAFEAIVSGEGFPDLPVTIADNGVAPDPKASDGEYSGGFTLPTSAQGNVSACGSVQGLGIVGDSRCAYADVRVRQGVEVQIELDAPGRMERGDRVSGTLRIRNAETAFRGALSVDELHEGADVVITPSVVQAETGQTTHRFTIEVRSSTPVGQLSGRVRHRDDANNVLAEAFFLTEVTEQASILDRFWALIVLGALAAAGGGMWLRSMRKARTVKTSVRGLLVTLVGPDGPEGPPLSATSLKPELVMRLRQEPPVRLEECPSSDPRAITLRRIPAGRISVTGPGISEQAGVGVEVLVADGYAIRVDDTAALKPATPTRPATPRDVL